MFFLMLYGYYITFLKDFQQNNNIDCQSTIKQEDYYL